jgi:CRISPR/Cas system CSM-associated protein Csm2 small subunit
VVFGFHPYLKKKTANYKEYLVSLKEAKLKPISQLMKAIGSSSLRLENFLKFLERMIDLNNKTRVSLAELKEFLRSTEPFKFMNIS